MRAGLIGLWLAACGPDAHLPTDAERLVGVWEIDPASDEGRALRALRDPDGAPVWTALEEELRRAPGSATARSAAAAQQPALVVEPDTLRSAGGPPLRWTTTPVEGGFFLRTTAPDGTATEALLRWQGPDALVVDRPDPIRLVRVLRQR